MTSVEQTPQQLRRSALALLLANLVPLAGVLFWQWSVSSVIVLYWFENIVIGVVNVARLVACSPSNDAVFAALAAAGQERSDEIRAAIEPALAGKNVAKLAHGFKLFLVPFFLIHYFGFCAGHGVFVFSMFEDTDGFFAAAPGIDIFGTLGRAVEIFSTPLALAAAALALSHAYSFVQNYLVGREYERLDLRRLMFMPYGRIIALHVTIIAGGFVTLALGEPLWVLVILVVAKTAVDLKMHLKEHRMVF